MTASKKLYYKIGEACKLLDIQPYVLRYWETEFPLLAPSKSKSGQRVYSEAELAVIKRIKELLYDEGFTIAGAKKRLEADLAAGGELKLTGWGVASEASDGVRLDEAGPSQAAIPLPAPQRGSGAEVLDTHATKRIESLREGIGEALRQARQIVDRLGPSLSH